jgi:murein L,D-transpeptidase YafK
MLERIRFASLLAICMVGAMAAVLAAAQVRAADERIEATRADAQFKRVLEDIGRGQAGAALEAVERLLAQYPNFRLAHLVRGDLLLARARPISNLGNTGHAGPERIEELRAEARARLRGYSDRPPDGAIPGLIVQLAASQRFAVVVDARRYRVFVYENVDGTPRLVADFYTTLGRNGIEKLREGDRKTPLGAYHVTSLIPGAKLPDLYGWGALPINYPNEWDRRSGKTGYGIWLHGVPADTYARAPRASDGCIALANPDFERLAGLVQPGVTPVVIADEVEWLDAERWRAARERFASRLEQWRRDWESGDVDRYLSHYAREFRAGNGMNRAAWDEHKRRVNATRSWIEVTLAELSVLRSPGKRELALATFEQRYRSSGLERRSRKRQYWTVEDGRWKIAYEGVALGAQLALPESFPSVYGAGAQVDGRSRPGRTHR